MAGGDYVSVLRAQDHTHRGIDMGDGTVVHFSGEPRRLQVSTR